MAMATDTNAQEIISEVNEIRQGLEQTENKWDDTIIKQALDNWRQHDLNIGLFGRTKAGKSSFINTLRGVQDTDPTAAAVDVVECTTTPTPYKHPDNNKLVIWDLPGIGGMRFKRNDYFKKINMDEYDFFLIFSRDGFTEIETWLAEEICKSKKKFFYVRTKVDLAIRNDKRDYPDTHDSNALLANILHDCERQLSSKVISRQVFLISNKHPNMFDFPKLMTQMIKEFPNLKKEALILSLSAFDSPELLQEKKKIFRKRAYIVALASAASAAIPIPGIGSAVDFLVITEEVAFYRRQFRLDDKSISARARSLNMAEDEFKTKFKLWSIVSITGSTAVRIGGMFASSKILENVTRTVLPIVGSVISSGISYTVTVRILLNFIDVAYDDAWKLSLLMAEKSGFDQVYDRYVDRSFQRSVAVLGEVGSGRSSLINSLLGLRQSDRGAAKVGVVKTTCERTRYTFPERRKELYELWDLPGLRQSDRGAAKVGVVKTTCERTRYTFPERRKELYELWDLPGVLTEKFPKDKYLKQIEFTSYDIYILCSSTTITETDIWLAKEVLKLGRPLFVVRTKLKDDINNIYQGDLSMEEHRMLILSRIRENYVSNLKMEGVYEDDRVFLLDNTDTDDFEFPSFKKKLKSCVGSCAKREEGGCIIL